MPTTIVISQTSTWIAIPMFECHTTDLNMVIKFINALYGWWHNKLIGMSSDGENMVTNRHSGFVTHMV
jgi:hypothetical protein